MSGNRRTSASDVVEQPVTGGQVNGPITDYPPTTYNRRTSAFVEMLLRCGHIIKVVDVTNAGRPGCYFCPYGCGPQTAVSA